MRTGTPRLSPRIELDVRVFWHVSPRVEDDLRQLYRHALRNHLLMKITGAVVSGRIESQIPYGMIKAESRNFPNVRRSVRSLGDDAAGRRT